MRARGQIFITDLFYVAIYYIALVPIWFNGLGTYVADALKGTDWAWLVGLLNVIVFIAPIVWLIVKAQLTRLALIYGG